MTKTIARKGPPPFDLTEVEPVPPVVPPLVKMVATLQWFHYPTEEYFIRYDLEMGTEPNKYTARIRLLEKLFPYHVDGTHQQRVILNHWHTYLRVIAVQKSDTVNADGMKMMQVVEKDHPSEELHIENTALAPRPTPEPEPSVEITTSRGKQN